MIINTGTGKSINKTKHIKHLPAVEKEREETESINKQDSFAFSKVKDEPVKKLLPFTRERESQEEIPKKITEGAIEKNNPSEQIIPGVAKGTFFQTGEPEFSVSRDLKTSKTSSIKDRQLIRAGLSSKEYKMLLNPEFFKNPEEGMIKFWDIAKEAADKTGLEITGKDSFELKDPRYIAYLDTPDFRLKELGYILRRRQDKKIKEKGKKEYELVLKYRSNDMETAASKDVSPAEEFKGESKFEQDIVAGKESIKNVYSKSSKVILESKTDDELEEYGEIFPCLTELGIDPEEEISFVNDRKMEEYKMQLGEIDLGNGVAAESSIAVWYKQGKSDEKEPVIAEFSFNYKISENNGPSAEADKFIKSLQKEADRWINEGSTKTEIIYGNQEGDDTGL